MTAIQQTLTVFKCFWPVFQQYLIVFDCIKTVLDCFTTNFDCISNAFWLNFNTFWLNFKQCLTIFQQYLTVLQQLLTVFICFWPVFQQYLNVFQQHLTVSQQFLTIFHWPTVFRTSTNDMYLHRRRSLPVNNKTNLSTPYITSLTISGLWRQNRRILGMIQDQSDLLTFFREGIIIWVCCEFAMMHYLSSWTCHQSACLIL